jgi:hypothetical protein
MENPAKTLRISRLHEQGDDGDLRDTTAAERIAMMWQLALDAWAFQGEPVEPQFQRHVVRIIRGRKDIPRDDQSYDGNVSNGLGSAIRE